MILTEIGEIGVHIDGQTHILRPSLYAMTQLGSPKEIVALYAAVMDAGPRLIDCIGVINACTVADVSRAFGCVVDKDGKLEYQPGLAPAEDVVAIARCLLKHGVTGALKQLPKAADAEYSDEFDARAMVAAAMAHLGLSSQEAWQSTMTELVGAFRSKFPPDAKTNPGSRAPTLEEHEQTMAWFEQVEAMRGGNV
ncbi:hypothetical protein AAV94_11115 [Lampropedia cohaerens]|uniref:Glycoprotein n=1 Tax=Lampropedia cohaerens TaxID=1610491 RepID=A0A0U1PXY6_9BURK|nr:DUF6246 family protein [Lampropedia cohaerens]KKW67382.1 hypothetical protein AAV94_11115 [Lampropedia cohaerens]